MLKRGNIELVAALLVAFAAALAFTPAYGGLDWFHHLKPATVAFAQGGSPYSVPGVYNPPWTFVLLLPFVYLPWQVMAVTGLVVYLASGLMAGLNKRMAGLLLLSPPVLMCIGMGNIDWLCLVGFWMRPLWLALFFMSIKPQLGLPFALFRLLWERKPLHALPVAAAFALSVVRYGFWFSSPADERWNLSLWPYAALVAVPLFLLALIKRRQWWILVLTPFMMPYVTAQGYVTTFYGAAGLSKWAFYAIFALGWILLLWRIVVWP